MFIRGFILASSFIVMCLGPPILQAQVLDERAQLEAQTFWDNRDWTWYERNIPFFECPDESINTTYYYRWELLTKHLVYGSPNAGYAFTEFIDRPFWSGTFGAISCPAGHQLYEARWLRNNQVAQDYARYWFDVAGAEPRRYSTWLADSVWAIHELQNDAMFAQQVLPSLVENYKLWERNHFVPEVGMFWQTGHDDGMEYNINSRQTQDQNRGAPGYRPTLNSYMFADALAIANIAELADDQEMAQEFRHKAEALKQRVQDKLWDDDRLFFFPMSKEREERDDHVVQPLTLTYQSGEFAGNPHGRELIGYVPWQFGLPDDEARYAKAWRFLMDEEFFAAPYGPTTVEQHDPLFVLKEHCCWWSGQSWPYATTQTLKAMANLLQNYHQDVISGDDYLRLLQTYTRSHRKEGRPYLAEALHPQTGSFAGHDGYNHSEHYFHSGYCDLIITGLVGLQPRADDTVEVKPLAPESWNYFALDRVNYHGHNLSIVWDRDGSRYGQGAGLRVIVDDQVIAQSESLRPLQGRLPQRSTENAQEGSRTKRRVNFAVNNDGNYFPRLSVSSTAPKSSPMKMIDGNYWYHIDPPNRWASASEESDATRDAAQSVIELDFGMARPIDTIKLYFLDDRDQQGEDAAIVPPAEVTIGFWSEADGWQDLPSVRKPLEQPVGHQANVITFPTLEIHRLRLTLTHPPHHQVGLTEVECWGEAELPVDPAPAPEGNVAFKRGNSEFPKVTASHTSRFDKLETVNDGRIVYDPTPANRWTSYESEAASDWLELEFEKPERIQRVVLHIYDDGGGVQAPRSYRIETFADGEWKPVENEARSPQQPTGGAPNSVQFDEIQTTKLRVIFQHQGQARSGLTEIEVWRD